ncbi:methylenetetrahydrofolate reductase [NAD(P)H] [Porticoccaceae bacterium]|jgi:methylenetetrahydrofolate reductase (NADPH)|nr:methylenetetrahydrofolate reductase [NAD(P)H] [Porticoccaceae bacterium]MDG2116571.1 methylenetetrahydrofolate reductase [NAD(P)H] [Porticoccaceae bacterium]|tara:strand:- start:2026 stop:2874 length:849 start_codon:yes stop_codon:yes gene_type:complete
MTNNPHISFEFFAAKTEEGIAKLKTTCRELDKFSPEFYSVTYGAGGSTRDTTKDIVLDIKANGYVSAPHLSVGGDKQSDIIDLVQSYKDAGITKLVALRGDLPSGVGGTKQLIHANELVSIIREHTSDHFEIYVAAYPEIHPEAESYSKDIYWLGEKFKAGANGAITQYFYNPDAYFRYIDECAKVGIDQPILPGIMPLTNYHNLVRFSDNCGADIPRWLRWQLKERSDNPQDLINYGIEVVTKLCEDLLAGGAPGLHFYTMNQWQISDTLCRNLGLPIKAV